MKVGWIDKLMFWKKIEEPEEELEYPGHFLQVLLTSCALEDGTEDDANKIIVRHFIDKYGYPDKQIYRYSKERLHSLKDEYGIPVHDKTEIEAKFPIFGRITPGEIRFVTD